MKLKSQDTEVVPVVKKSSFRFKKLDNCTFALTRYGVGLVMK